MENRDFIEQHFILKENQAKARGDTDQERRFPDFPQVYLSQNNCQECRKVHRELPAYWGLRMQEGAD
jgi:hypothetical protein